MGAAFSQDTHPGNVLSHPTRGYHGLLAPDAEHRVIVVAIVVVHVAIGTVKDPRVVAIVRNN